MEHYIQIPGELVTLENNNVQKWMDIEKEAGLIKREVTSISDVRQVVRQSTNIREYAANVTLGERWNIIYGQFLCYRKDKENVRRS